MVLLVNIVGPVVRLIIFPQVVFCLQNDLKIDQHLSSSVTKKDLGASQNNNGGTSVNFKAGFDPPPQKKTTTVFWL